ncbi:MAG: translation elongation factor Ts [Treponema sp.]|jgi:elongation factor Ts|nr:translation elongation factor Ts [Treponema sp.]
MAVSAADVKMLRERTGAGPMECKKALEETSGDFAQAEKLLKEKGLAAVEKRADRATNEGKIFIKIKDNVAVLVELASETDFVARNPEFIALGGTIADLALAKGYAEPNEELSNMVTDLATKIRENMGLKRIKMVKAGAGEYLTQYIHGDGAIGVVVKMGSGKPEVFEKDEAKEFAFTLALHVAAFNPLALDKSQVSQAVLAEQEEIFRKQMESDEKFAGKPANVIDNILKGKMAKYLSDICLLEQGYVKDEKFTVSQVVENMSKQLGASLKIVDYVYFKVGE